MQDDTLWVQQSLENHLFYLRTIKEFCIHIILSLPASQKIEKSSFNAIEKKATKLLQKSLDLAQGNISECFLKNQLIVTPFTLPLEELTTNLFSIKIDTTLTKRELELKTSSIEITSSLIKKLTILNQQAYKLTVHFLNTITLLKEKIKDHPLFIYTYPCLLKEMKEEVFLYQADLERLINRSGKRPIFISNYEYYFSTFLRDASKLIRSLSDPTQSTILERAYSFENDFHKIITKFNSYAKDELKEKIKKLVTSYQDFLVEIIENILNQELYFMIEPLFFNHFYTTTNYFRYLLENK